MIVAEQHNDNEQVASFEAALRSRQAQAPARAAGTGWRADLAIKGDGSLRANVGNAILILEHDDAWAGCLRLNTFSNQIEKIRQPPYPHGSTGELTDADAIEIAAWVGRHYNLDLKTTLVHEALLAVATRNPFHPVRDYLDSLVWDGTPRLAGVFPRYFGAHDSAYVQAVGLAFFIGAVARIYAPGCKVDTMVILEGAQGIGKTRSVRALAGASWYAEATESPSSKDFYQALRGKWLVEIGEMQAFSRAEANKIKQVITVQSDNYRPSYGRYARDFPRQSVFIGTTNEAQYLNDPTGARRFLPVRCAQADADAIVRDRDQLWAEAVARYRDGEPWWAIPAAARDEQEARFNADSWEDVVADWLDGRAADTAYPAGQRGPIDQVTVTEVLRWALGMELSKHDRGAQTRVGNILRRLGWRPVQVRAGEGRRRCYQRPVSQPHRL